MRSAGAWVLLWLGLCSQAIAGQPPGVATTDARLRLPVSQRAPGAADDITRGYLAGGNVINVPSNGSGFTSAPTITFTAGGCAVEPTAVAIVASGAISGVTVTNPGRGCTSAQNGAVSGGGGSGASVYAYPITSLWLFNGVIYQALDVSAQHAVWAPSSRARVADAVTAAGGSTPSFAVGICKLRAAYAGNAFTITRASDSTTLTVPFNTNGCVTDTSAIDQFVSGTTGYFTTINDQSGNGNDCIQATLANAPVYTPGQLVGSFMAINFNSISPAINGQPAVAKWCTSAATAWTPTTGTLMFAASLPLSVMGRAMVSNTANTYGIGAGGLVSGKVGAAIIGVGAATNMPPVVGPGLWTYSAGGGSMVNVVENAADVSNSGTVATQTGLQIGMNSVSSPGIYDMLGLAYWPAQLSASSLTAARAAMHQTFQITPQAEDALVFMGDSLETNGSTLSNSYPKFAAQFYSRPIQIYSLSIFGQTAQAIATGGSGTCSDAQCAGFALPLLYKAINGSTLRTFTVSLKAGMNDIRANSRTGPQAYAYMQTIAAAIRALPGQNVHLIAGTSPLQNDILNNAAWLAITQIFNGLIQNGWSAPLGTGGAGGLGADSLLDLWANPVIGQANYTSSFFSVGGQSPDGAHLLDYGQHFEAMELANTVNALLAKY